MVSIKVRDIDNSGVTVQRKQRFKLATTTTTTKFEASSTEITKLWKNTRRLRAAN